MANSALPKTVRPQGGTVLKAFAFDPALNYAVNCGQERLPLTNFILTNTSTSNLCVFTAVCTDNSRNIVVLTIK